MTLAERERAAVKLGEQIVGRRAYPHLRCGICDEPIAEGADSRYVDDERCHRGCAQAGDPGFIDEYPDT